MKNSGPQIQALADHVELAHHVEQLGAADAPIRQAPHAEYQARKCGGVYDQAVSGTMSFTSWTRSPTTPAAAPSWDRSTPPWPCRTSAPCARHGISRA